MDSETRMNIYLLVALFVVIGVWFLAVVFLRERQIARMAPPEQGTSTNLVAGSAYVTIPASVRGRYSF